MRMKKQKKRNNAGIVVGRPFERLGALGTGAVFPGLCARRHVDRRSDTRRAHHALRYGHEKEKLTIKLMNRFLVTTGVVRLEASQQWYRLQFSIEWKLFTKYSRRRSVAKGKGLFDVRRTVVRMRVPTGGGHLAFQSTAASGRQCTTARRLRNYLSRTDTGCLSCPDIFYLRTSCLPAILHSPLSRSSFERYLDPHVRLVIAAIHKWENGNAREYSAACRGKCKAPFLTCSRRRWGRPRKKWRSTRMSAKSIRSGCRWK